MGTINFALLLITTARNGSMENKTACFLTRIVGSLFEILAAASEEDVKDEEEDEGV